MRFAVFAAVAVVVLSPSWAVAQNASTGSTTTSGDSAVSPAAGGPGHAGATATRPNPGGGIASGTMNNGTTGDTIGTGSGTSSPPATGQTPADASSGKK